MTKMRKRPSLRRSESTQFRFMSLLLCNYVVKNIFRNCSEVDLCLFSRMMNHKRMPKRSSRGSPTTGETGPSSEAGTAFISGVMQLLWSSPMEAMVGSASSWMVNWPPCTPVEAQRVALTVQVGPLHTDSLINGKNKISS